VTATSAAAITRALRLSAKDARSPVSASVVCPGFMLTTNTQRPALLLQAILPRLFEWMVSVPRSGRWSHGAVR
jgi:hypothetical protein